VTTGLGQLFIEMIEDGAAVEHAESDIDPGPEFPGVKGLAEIIVGRYTSRRP
jgi:hypothetical protein